MAIAISLLVAVWMLGSSTLAQAAAVEQTPSAPATPPATQDPAFDILEFVIDGNRVLDKLSIERAVYPFLGEKRRIADAESARAALEKAYHQAGYLTVLVSIPEQRVENGVVRLSVLEGQIERLRIVGSRYFDQGYIRRQVPSLAPGAVPDFPRAQEELAQVSRSPDRRVTPVLRPGTAPGTVEVELKVEDQLPVHGNVELSNRRSPNTSALRLGMGLRYDNLWQRGHSFGLQAQTAPQNTDDVKVLSATYLMPVGRSDAQLMLYAVESRSDVATVGNVNVIGDGTILGLRYVLPLPSGPRVTHTLSLGADRKEFRESVSLLGADTVNTPITYLPLVAQYNAALAGERRRTQFSAGASFGPRGWFGNEDRDFSNKRFGALSNFFVLKADLGHERWSASGWGVKGRIDVQFANQPLISNEQYSGGGADSVRGYLENEAQGDDGVRLGAELHTPLLWTLDEKSGAGLAALGFVEAASLRVQEPLPAQRASFDLASVGLGLRLRGLRGWTGAMDVAWPLREGPQTKSRTAKVLLRIGYDF